MPSVAGGPMLAVDRSHKRRRIISITGTRADYGLMEPVHRAIAADSALELHLIVTRMHMLPEFVSSLEAVRYDRLGILHEIGTLADKDSGEAMAAAVGYETVNMSGLFDKIVPDLVLLQGDRGEMLAGAIVAAHMNIPVVHMSGGDTSGSIDDSVRNAISKLASFHLTNCASSTETLVAMGEDRARIVEVGEPGLDQLLQTEFIPLEDLAGELKFRPDEKFLIATLHPVTNEADHAAHQMRTLLNALESVGLTTVFTYPNTDAGGIAMRAELEAARGKPFLRVVSSLGSRRYLSLLRHAAAVVGNSSSGIFDTPTLKVPSVNVGTRQLGRVRAENVVDVDFDTTEIANAVRFVIEDDRFRAKLAQCRNPYGDGRAAERTVDILKRLKLNRELAAKWLPSDASFV